MEDNLNIFENGRRPHFFYFFLWHLNLKKSSLATQLVLFSVKIRLHTENQLPRLSGSALKVCVGWVPLNYVVTPTVYWVEVGLGQLRKLVLESDEKIHTLQCLCIHMLVRVC